jgi:F-box protein 11
MGAEQATCDERGSPTRLVRIAEGVYDAGVCNVTPSVSIEGAGVEKTVLRGTIAGLRTGATLSSVTVTGGSEAGIFVAGQESPEIHDCAVAGNDNYGVMCMGPCTPAIRQCTVSGNSSGGLRCESGAEPSLEGCSISDNSGSGVSCIGAAPRLKGCSITGNMAVQGAGLHLLSSSPRLEDCIIAGNSASFGPDPFAYYEHSQGGGVFCASASAPRFERCSISGNAAMIGGGFYSTEGSDPVLQDCIVWSNAGKSVVLGTGFLTASTSCIENVVPWTGIGNTNLDPRFCGWGSAGEVHVDPASPGPGDGTAGSPYREIGSAFAGFSLALTAGSPCIGSGSGGNNMGAAEGTCGGLGRAERIVHLAAGNYSLRGLTFAHHVSLEGAGEGKTVLEGTVTGLRDGALLSSLTVTGGCAGIVIGNDSPEIRQVTIERVPDVGLRCYRSSAAFVRSTIQECTAGVEWNLGAPAFTDSTIRRNTSAGLDLAGTSGVLESCVFSENGGPGILLSAAQPTLQNCLVTGNSSGGIDVTQGSAPTLANCVVADNSRGAANGGGILCSVGHPELYGCIVWGNLPNSIWLEGASSLSAAHSCLEVLTPWPGTGNINDDPLFVKAAEYNFNNYSEIPVGEYFLWIPDFLVEAPDYHLQPGSPALNAGEEAGPPSTDFDGNPRPACGALDMGIYESSDCPEAIAFLRGDSNDDGKKDITDPIFTLAYLFLGGPKPPCLKSADVNDDRRVDITDAIYLLSHLFLGGPRPRDPFGACGLDPTEDSLTCWAFAHCP